MLTILPLLSHEISGNPPKTHFAWFNCSLSWAFCSTSHSLVLLRLSISVCRRSTWTQLSATTDRQAVTSGNYLIGMLAVQLSHVVLQLFDPPLCYCSSLQRLRFPFTNDSRHFAVSLKRNLRAECTLALECVSWVHPAELTHLVNFTLQAIQIGGGVQ